MGKIQSRNKDFPEVRVLGRGVKTFSQLDLTPIYGARKPWLPHLDDLGPFI